MAVLRRTQLAAVALLVVLTMVTGLVAVVVHGPDTDGGDDTASSDGRATTLAPTPATADALDTEVAAIERFVADARDLEFIDDVDVELLADDEFAARVRDTAVEDVDELAETEDVLRALALLPDDIDLASTLTSFLGDSIVGFYDPETNELVVRGAEITPYVRATLAHELTHALDDQHFELDRPALDEADDESAIAFSALAEGNAVRIQEQFEASLSDEEREQVDDEEARLAGGVDLSDVPRVLPELIGFPYVVGPALVGALVAEGGERRVDAAFADPPTTSEQTVDPAAWLAGEEEPVGVTPPPADGEVFDQGVLGFLGIVVLLEDAVGQGDAATAARGWGGDWYVAWHDGSRTCVRNTLVMDTRGDLDELVSALDEWVVAQDDATLTRDADRVTFTACG